MLSKVDWCCSSGLVPYENAVAFMEKRVAAIAQGTKAEMVWLLEHPSLYTAGTGASPQDILNPLRFPVYKTGRGGRYTYHAPGQRVIYLMIDLRHYHRDVRNYVRMLEEWIIGCLAHFKIKGKRRPSRVGIWIDRGDHDDKIAAIGVRIRRWISYHGIALNINVELSGFQHILPCGIEEHGLTSLAELGIVVSMADVDTVLKKTFKTIFGRQVRTCQPPVF